MNIIIASHNQGKIEEFKQLLQPLGHTIKTLADYPMIGEIEETGQTFAENALLKANSIAQQTQCITLADDSGLVVPALNGAPGVHSARYSGQPTNDQANNQKLLEEMLPFQDQDRQAYFISTIAVVYPDYAPLIVEGRVDGYISESVMGEDGFGYDPLFYYPEKKASFAQIPMSEKNQISHRGQAIKELMKVFPEWLERVEQVENTGN